MAPEDEQPAVNTTSMKRGAQPEVAWCVVFLASDDASYVTAPNWWSMALGPQPSLRLRRCPSLVYAQS